MSKTIVNLTTELLTQKIEDVLETYPQHPYQEAFANPDCRQGLISYVLTRIPNEYMSVEEEEQELVVADYLHQHPGKISQIETTIRQGIEEILCEQAEEVRRHIPEMADPGFVASDWFG
jgi:hypothetical protein